MISKKSRLLYNQNLWPPSPELAELHSRCTEPGLPDGRADQCPCCGDKPKHKQRNWAERDLYKDFRDKGALIAYFKITRLLAFVVLTVFCLSLYPFVLHYQVCSKHHQLCVNEFGGIFQVLSLHELFANLDQTNTIVLDVVFLVMFIVLQSTNLLIVVAMQQAEHSSHTVHLLKHNSVLLKNIAPDSDQESIKELIRKLCQVGNIIEITILRACAQYADIQEQRNKLYFLSKSYQTDSITPKQMAKYEAKLIQLQEQYSKSKLDLKSTSRALLLFRYHRDAIAVKQFFKLNAFGRFKVHWDKVLGIENNIIYSSSVNDPKQIIWKYIGEDSTTKTVERFKTSVISLLAIAVFMAFLFVAFYFRDQFEDGTQLTLVKKLFINLVAVGLFVLLSLYSEFLRRWARRRRPTSYQSQSIFVVTMTMFFHELFYIIVPISFFEAATGFDQTIKLYFLDSQCRMFLIIQLIMSLTDLFYCCWKRKKAAVLSDSREWCKLRQKQLNQKVAFPQFPFEFKVVLTFKIWSFCMFYCFYSPFLVLLLGLFLVMLYVRDKRSLYLRYRISKTLTIKFIRKFLNLYLLYFSGFLLFVYLYGVAQYTLSVVLASILTFAVILASFLIQCRHLRKMRTFVEQCLGDRTLEQVRTEAKQTGIYLQTDSFKEEYQKFIEGLHQSQLDKQIGQFVKFLKGRATFCDQEMTETTRNTGLAGMAV